MRKMSRDSREAFTATIQPHFTRLYRLAYRLTGGKDDAEDLIQDVLIKLYERRAELSSIREPAPWLGRVLYNQFVDNKRRYLRQPLQLVGNPETDLGDSAQDSLKASRTTEPQVCAENTERHEVLRAALSRLSEEHRVILLMHDSEGYKLTEIQELTGIPAGTVKSRLSRARSRLRELLGRSEYAPSRNAVERKKGTFSDIASCNSTDGVGNDAL